MLKILLLLSQIQLHISLLAKLYSPASQTHTQLSLNNNDFLEATTVLERKGQVLGNPAKKYKILYIDSSFSASCQRREERPHPWCFRFVSTYGWVLPHTQGHTWFSWSSYSTLSSPDTKSSGSQRAIWLCSAITGEVAHHTRGGHDVTSQTERERKKFHLCSVAEWLKKMHLKRSFLFLWGSDSCLSAHHHDGKVIHRPPTLRESNFTGNLQWLLGQSYTLIPEGKHHYGLSFISAVLGQFKPTQRTPFLEAAVEDLVGGGGGGWGVTEAMTDGKIAIGSKIWFQPIITSFFFFFTRTCQTVAGLTFDWVQLSGMQIC